MSQSRSSMNSSITVAALLSLFAVTGCFPHTTPTRFDIELDISLPSAQHSLELPVFNPLSSQAKLIGFQASCGCGTPQFVKTEVPASALVSVPATLDTKQIQSKLSIDRELVLEPLFDDGDGRAVTGVPIVLLVTQGFPMTASPSSLAMGESSSAEIKILSADKIDLVRVVDVPDWIELEIIQSKYRGESPCNWILNVTSRVVGDASKGGAIRVQGFEQSGKLVSELSIPVSAVVSQPYYLSTDILAFSGSRSRFEATLNRPVPPSHLHLDDPLPEGFVVEGFHYCPDTGRVEFDLQVSDSSPKEATLVFKVGENLTEAIAINVYRLGGE
jgi:hypothetical protein